MYCYFVSVILKQEKDFMNIAVRSHSNEEPDHLSQVPSDGQVWQIICLVL